MAIQIPLLVGFGVLAYMLGDESKALTKEELDVFKTGMDEHKAKKKKVRGKRKRKK